MGILDQLSNLSPEQSQGLLAAAASLLQSGGPSRMPTSFGQALGGGLTAYQQSTEAARRRKIEEAQAGQVAKLTGLKIQDAESDLANQSALRDRAEQLRQFNIRYGAGGAPESVQTPAAMGSDLAPTVENSQRMASMQPASSAAGGGNQKDGIYQQRLAYAQALRSAGYSSEADAAEASALKFQPKVKGWEKVQQGGKVMYAPFYEDGTSGAPVPLEVAEKLEKVNTGGSTALVNPYTGAPVRAMANTQTPDSIASNATAVRGQNISRQNAIDALATPTYNQEAGGFITRPTASSPGGKFTPLSGSTKGPKLTEDQGKATGWLVQAENAFANMKAATAANPSAAKPGINDIIGAIPGVSGGANLLRGEDRQKFLQGASSLSESLLRAATGAGVNKEEALQKQRELTPQIGDSDAVIKQKMDSIPLYIDSLKVRAGAGAPKAEEVLANNASKNLPKSKIVTLDGGGSATATLGADGKYYVKRGGKNYRVEE